MTLDIDTLRQTIAQNGPTARIVIAAHAGSTPRETGTAMLVWTTGQSGTIGGGALEHGAIARARALLGTPGARHLDRHPLGPALAQCCGGTVTLLTEVFADTSTLPDAGLYARPTSDTASPEPLAITRARRTTRAGHPPPHLLTDGWFAEPISPALTPLWIYGAGHVGRALVATLAGLPYTITWIDDARARFPERIPDHATMLVAQNPTDAARLAAQDAHHLILTYSHALDLDLCHQILSQPFASLGLIGSATKRARFLKRLRALGHSEQSLARLTCPIGDPSLGKHPQAIAVSVVHALLKPQAAATSGATSKGQHA